MSVLKIENLTHIYSKGTPYEKAAIDNINLEINKGEFIGVIGHTGSGKSTLIQHFNGLLKPDSGKIFVNGEDMWADKNKIKQFRFKVGLVFQYPEYQLFEETVYKDIAYGPGNMGLSESEVNIRVKEAAEFVGLKPEHLDRSPFDLSGGQKRRVAIAGVIAMRPEILVLDEPTAGLDPKGREKILHQIQDYHKRTGSTIILVSHSMEDIARFASKILVMNSSKVEMFDTVDNVFSQAERLIQIGLEVPDITRIFIKLKQSGLNVSKNVYSVEQGLNELLKLSKKGRQII